MRRKKGITLIALVITIIVLLILAGISIMSLIGENGIIEKASLAKEATRAAHIEEYVNLKELDNETIGNDRVTKQEAIEELYQNGMLTDEELLKLQTQDTITVGNTTIDFSKLNFTYVGKFVYYKDLKFIVVNEDENKLTLQPLIFSNQYNYLLSGKYIEENGNKVSVDHSINDALSDETFEEFDARIKAELDGACQDIFGTNDGKITAVNTDVSISYSVISYLENEEGLLEVVNYVPDNPTEEEIASNKIIVDNVCKLMDEEYEKQKDVYDLTDSMIENSIKDNISVTGAALWLVVGMDFPILEEGRTLDYEVLLADAHGVINDTLLLEDIKDDNYRLLLTIIDKVAHLYAFDTFQIYWTTETEKIESANNGIWRVHSLNGSDPFHDTIDWVSLMSCNNYSDGVTMQYTYASKALPLAPILTVDSELLVSIGGNDYEI